MKNLKEAKELLERYKNITLEQLKDIYKRHPDWEGLGVMSSITDFGTIYCLICEGASHVCKKCIYSFRIVNKWDVPCMDIIYNEMKNATSAEELFNALQKRISYLNHIIQWYETNKTSV